MARKIDADAFERFLMNLPDEVLCEDCCYVVVNEMRKQPTIDPVKHGKWVEKTWHSRGGYRYLKCDCGKEHCIEKPIDDVVYTCSECGKINEASFYNYCPSCGARMDGE